MITAISSVNKNNQISSVKNQSKQVSFTGDKPAGDKVMQLLRNLSFTPKAKTAEEAAPVADGIPKTGLRRFIGLVVKGWNVLFD